MAQFQKEKNYQIDLMKSKNEECVERLRVSDSKVKVLQDELTKQR